jgi:hypothetical protein
MDVASICFCEERPGLRDDPNTIMNRRMKPISQRSDALGTNSRSTLAAAMVISGELVSKLMSRMCFGESTNGRVEAHEPHEAVLGQIVAQTDEAYR